MTVRFLFLHHNFPAQFRDLAPALAADPRHEVAFITKERGNSLPGVRKVVYGQRRRGGEKVHRYLRELERAVLSGQGAYLAAKSLRAEGFIPDVIYGHSGWGPTLFVQEVFPEARLMAYFDWFYRPRGSNGDFFPAKPMDADRACLFRARNAAILLDLAQCDWGLVTTEWQLAQFPADAYAKLSLLHDGIRCDFWTPEPGARFANATVDLSGAEELITYATRGMEPYRGFDTFLRAVELLLRRRPKAQVLIAGEERHAYSWSPPDGSGSWKRYLLSQVDLDLSRVHFVGPIPQVEMRQLMRVSDAHVYFSAPFIPSWSLFEAMSCGALVVGSTTPPVEELITDGHNGLLTDFFDHEALADRLNDALDHRERYEPLRRAARATITSRYDLQDVLPRQLRLIDEVVAGAPAREREGSVAARLDDPAIAPPAAIAGDRP